MKKCFIIGPLTEGAEADKRADWVYRTVDEGLKPLDYKTEHVRNINIPGVAMQEITRHLVEDDIVVADLAIDDPNVYYEMAIRHAVGKPIINLGMSKQPRNLVTDLLRHWRKLAFARYSLNGQTRRRR